MLSAGRAGTRAGKPDSQTTTATAPLAHPLAFVPNRGQAPAPARYLAQIAAGPVFLTEDSAVFPLPPPGLRAGSSRGRSALTSATELRPGPRRGARVAMSLRGAIRRELKAEAPLTGRASYMRGADSSRWVTDLPTFAQLRQAGVYPGIDLVYHGTHGAFEYDFHVAPDADPGDIRLQFTTASALSPPTRVRLDGDGGLTATVGNLAVRQNRPVAYQETGGSRRPVDASFRMLADGSVGFRIGRYDPTRPLVIDPTLAYSTYLGGSEADVGEEVAVDATGSAYVVGSSFSQDFPTSIGAYDGTFNGFPADFTCDVFVSRLNAAGTGVLFSTYIGGRDYDYGLALALGPGPTVVVTGRAFSTDFPTTAGAFDQSHNGAGDIFVAKLSNSGSTLLYSTFVGGELDDRGRDIVVDGDGNTYVTGSTQSQSFPVANAFQSTKASLFDVVLFCLNPSGDAMTFSTYFGGDSFDEAWGLARDNQGLLYLTGSTDSLNFPKIQPLQDRSGSFGQNDAFISVFGTDGTPIFSTYLGGNDEDYGLGIGALPGGGCVVTGVTFSENFPLVSPLQSNLKGEADAFLAQLKPARDGYVFSTFFGGKKDEYGNAVAVDGSGAITLAGETLSTDLKVVDAFQGAYAGTGEEGFGDGFVTRLRGGGDLILYSSYLGGNGDDYCNGVAVDASNASYITGSTNSTNFKVTSTAVQKSLRGATDAFVTKVAGRAQPPAAPSNLLAQADGLNVRLQWSDNSINETSFRVERRFLGGATWSTIVTLGPDVISYIDTETDPGTTYEYRVRSANAAGESGPSNIATVRTGGSSGGRLAVSTTLLNFGKVKVGKPRRKELIVRNDGTIDINVATGAVAAPFILVSGGGNYLLGPGETRLVMLEFRPSAKKKTSRTIVFSSDDSAPRRVTVTLKGLGR